MDGSTKEEHLFRPFIYVSLCFGLFAGLSLAALISVSLGAGLLPAPNLVPLIQAHGLCNISGWIGLMLTGVSLLIYPRVFGLRFVPHKKQKTILWLYSLGISLQSVSLLSYAYFPVWNYLKGFSLVVGSILDLIACILYINFLLFASRRKEKNSLSSDDLKRLLPWFLGMFSGLLIFYAEYVFLAFRSLALHTSELDPALLWIAEEAIIRLGFISGILGFGTKMLPVFLGINAPKWPIQFAALFYVVAILLYLSCSLTNFFIPIIFITSANHVFLALADMVIVGYIAAFAFSSKRVSLPKIDIVSPDKKRKGFPDRGEFGQFELFIYAGGAWLIFALLLEIIFEVWKIFGENDFSLASTRHAILLGFVVNFVIGLSFRLLPGLLKISWRNTSIVTLCWMMLNFSVLARIALAFSRSSVAYSPICQKLFQISGPCAFLALLMLVFSVVTSRTSNLGYHSIKQHSASSGNAN